MDWERAYQENDTPWDLRAPSPPLLALLESGRPLDWRLPQPPRVLVPGCGRGHDLRLWAEAGARVTGYDLSPQVVTEARQLLTLNQVEAHVECRDLLGFPASDVPSFDLIYDYTCLCAMTPVLRPVYARALTSLLAPGGSLLLLAFPFQQDFGNPGTPPFRLDRAVLHALFEPMLCFEEEFAVEASVPERAGAERWLRWSRGKNLQPN